MLPISLLLKAIVQPNTHSLLSLNHIIKSTISTHTFVYGAPDKIISSLRLLIHLCLTNLLFITLFSFSAQAKTPTEIDLLVVIEPDIFSQANPNRLSRESVQAALIQQLNMTNSTYELVNIHYNLRAVLDWEENEVSQRINQGESYQHALGDLMYSIMAPFPSSITQSIYLSNDDPRARVLLKQYYADKLIFITQEKDTSEEPYGAAFNQLGISLHIDALMQMPSAVAHLLGHTLALTHPTTKMCQSMSLLMCNPHQFTVGLGLSIDEITWLGALIKGEAIHTKDGVDNRYYLGDFSPAMPKLATIQLDLEQSQLSNEQPITRLNLLLINERGEPNPLDKDTSVELYTQSGSAIPDFHYAESLYQRVTFLAGETHKQIIIKTQSSNHHADFTLGTRHGILVNDSQQLEINIIGDISQSAPSAPTEPQNPTIEIKTNPNPSAPVIDNDSGGDDSNTPIVTDTTDDSGTMTLWFLLILISAALTRRGITTFLSNKKPLN